MSDIALEGFRVVLEATRDLPAVPFLREAASIALRILNIARDVRSQSRAFDDLATDACNIVQTIVVECQNIAMEGRELPERLHIHIASLARNLSTVEKFARKKVGRGTIKKIILHSKDLAEISRYRQVLRQSLDVFGIQTSISIQANLHHVLDGIQQQNAEVMANLQHQEDVRRRQEEELLSRLEILRIQEEERNTWLSDGTETLQGSDQEDSESYPDRLHQSHHHRKKRETKSSTEKKPHHCSEKGHHNEYDFSYQSSSKYPTDGSFYETFMHPSSPYAFSGFYPTPFFIPGLYPTMPNISGGSVSMGESNTVLTNYNCGNITNTVITDSMNSHSSKKKIVRAEYDSSGDEY